MKKDILILISAFAVLIVVPVLIFSWEPLMEGDFSYSVVYSEESPDGNSRLNIMKKTAFPATEFVDPSIFVKVRVSNHFPPYIIEKLLEDSDLVELPEVVWDEHGVVIPSLSTRKLISLRFKTVADE